MTATSSSASGKPALLPVHIAIVPDGNGRWAEKRQSILNATLNYGSRFEILDAVRHITDDDIPK